MEATYCRVCLGHKGAGSSIHEFIARTDTLYTALCRLCPAAFTEKDNSRWSAFVCKPCKRHIIVTQDLYELCIRSTQRLQQLDVQESKEKGEDTDSDVLTKNTTAEQEDEFDAVFFGPPEDAPSGSAPNANPPDEPTKEEKKVEATEQDDEFDADFFGTSEDLVAEAPEASTSIEIGGDTIALVKLESLLGTAKQECTTSRTMDLSSDEEDFTMPATDDSVRSTSPIGVNSASSGVVYKTATTDTADVEMDSPGCTESESEDEITKIFNQETFYCWDRCGMYFFDKPSFDKHLMDHKMRRRWFCKFCFEGFNTQALLGEHLPSHDRSLLCEICGELVATPEENNHDHSKIGPFDCPKCPRQFQTQTRLSKHMERHGAKRFCCDVCGLYLSSAKRLRNHKAAKHSGGEKPFSCDICGHRFAVKDTIKAHMRTHSGEKRFACMFCDRRYGASNDLKDHLRKHLGEKIYQCDQCDDSFRLIKELKEHYEQVHFQDGASNSTRRPDFKFTLNYLVNLRRQKQLDKLYVSEEKPTEPGS
ncbi:zinc finger and SCAN domain-containing protein 2-like [Anopheles aquasalis]|uniref:zinc finger and SCAN domain-containing protein 2-like n=1 Tax=Anopheles aquasalis TaxID=42839 RepID=UPI00215A112B|nr:zinc finger and SCAN domain-containing protein 2-like [Anopheles aquasalis]